MDYWAARTAASEAYAQRLAAKFSARLKKLYRDVYEILADELDHIAAQVLDHGKKAVLRSDLWRYSSITNLMDTIEQQADVLRTAQIEGMDSLLYNVFEETIGKTVEAFRGKEIKFSFLPENVMRQYLNTNWCGANYSSRIWTNTANLAARLKEDMMNLIATGKNPSAVKKKLSEDLGVGYDVADRLIRTEASHVYNTATMEAYRQQGINEVRISTGKDERVCPVCDEYQSHGPYPIGNAPRLPAHPNCRCRYLAVFDPEERARQRAEKLRTAINAEEILPRSLGAKAKNYLIVDAVTGTEYTLVEGVRQFQNAEVFAGYGSKTPLHEGVAEGLTERYGGSPERWQHLKGICVIDDGDLNAKAEVHWFQEESVGKVKLKIKEWLE